MLLKLTFPLDIKIGILIHEVICFEYNIICFVIYCLFILKDTIL